MPWCTKRASGPTISAEMRQERDDVVLRLPLDGIDPPDIERGVPPLRPDGLGRRFRDDAELGQRVAGMRLDLEPDAEPGLGLPDGHHGGAGIARDHGGSGERKDEAHALKR